MNSLSQTATATLAPGWSVYAGMVWNRVNYVDALASVKHEQYADGRVELNARITEKVTLRFSYEHTRDAEYFNPYFERFQGKSEESAAAFAKVAGWIRSFAAQARR